MEAQLEVLANLREYVRILLATDHFGSPLENVNSAVVLVVLLRTVDDINENRRGRAIALAHHNLAPFTDESVKTDAPDSVIDFLT